MYKEDVITAEECMKYLPLKITLFIRIISHCPQQCHSMYFKIFKYFCIYCNNNFAYKLSNNFPFRSLLIEYNLFTPKIHILHISRSLLFNMNLNFWNSSISLNEGTTELIFENNSLRHSSNLGHFRMKCMPSSGSILQRGHILFSTGSLMYLPLSIFRLLLLIQILTKIDKANLSISECKNFSIL